MKRVLVHVTGHGQDGCAWYRGIGPWSALGRDYSDQYNVCFFNGEAQWGDLRQAHCLFLLRPYTKPELNMAQMAKKLGIPIWVDWDDWLFGLTPDNPARFIYEDQKVRGDMHEILRLATVVTVTTQALREALFAVGISQCVVIPNSYDSHFDRIQRIGRKRSKAVQILFRGTTTHQRDLATVDEAIVDVDQCPEAKELAWFFLGLEPYSVEKLRSHMYVHARGVFEYFELLGNLYCDIGIVPLVDTKFNRCKSNIAAMEMAVAGAVPIVPNWPEWNNIPGVMTYDDVDDFKKQLCSVCLKGNFLTRSNLELRNRETLDYFRGELSLSKANKNRVSLLEGL